MKILRHLPNALTCGNLVCGCLGILSAVNHDLYTTAYLVWVACVFDFFDGFAARWLKVTSPIGKQLDSLADMVSFGVLPAMVMFEMIRQLTPMPWLPYSAFLIAVFSALRLANFNIDERQSESFIGLPTPANTLFITSLVFLDPPLNLFTSHAYYMVFITIIFSWLLVAQMPLFALKFKNFQWKGNEPKFILLASSVLLVITLKASALPLIILLYLVLSLFYRTSNQANS